MTAVFSGVGLGLERSSAWLLGGRAQYGTPGIGRANDAAYVNAASGNLVIHNTDEILVGRGPDAVFNRTYNSLGTYSGDTDNWLTNGQRKIVLTGTANSAGSTATLTDRDGSVVVFSFVSTSAGYRATEKPYRDDTLAITTNTWSWTEGKTQRVETYDNANGGRILSSVDADGAMMAYDYDGSGYLIKVTTANSATGEQSYVTLTYSGGNLTSLVTSYADLSLATPAAKTLTRVRYTYDSANRLSTVSVDLSPEDNLVSDGNIFSTTYAYTTSSSKLVSLITQTDGTNVAFTYDGSGRVTLVTQTTAAGVTRTTGLSYDTTNRITTLTDALGYQTKMTYDAAGRLVKLEEPSAVAGGNVRITEYVYGTGAANDDVLSITVFDGVASYSAGTAFTRETCKYDMSGNLIERQDLLGNTIRWTYGSKNEVLTETHYTGVDADGIAGSAQPTGAMTTRYAYDNQDRLRFIISAEGRVTEYRYGYGAGYPPSAELVRTGPAYSLSGLADNVSIAEGTIAYTIGNAIAGRIAGAGSTRDGFSSPRDIANAKTGNKDVDGNGIAPSEGQLIAAALADRPLTIAPVDLSAMLAGVPMIGSAGVSAGGHGIVTFEGGEANSGSTDRPWLNTVLVKRDTYSGTLADYTNYLGLKGRSGPFANSPEIEANFAVALDSFPVELPGGGFGYDTRGLIGTSEGDLLNALPSPQFDLSPVTDGKRDYASYAAMLRANPGMQTLSAPVSGAALITARENQRFRMALDSTGTGSVGLGMMVYARGGDAQEIALAAQGDSALGGLAAGIAVSGSALRAPNPVYRNSFLNEGPLVAGTSAKVVWNNGYRTEDGKFASPLGPGRPGGNAEVGVWNAIEVKPGWRIDRGPIAVRDASGQLRYYDGLATSPSKQLIGLEIKSGGATRNAAQRNFDTMLNSSPSNVATGVGRSAGITVQRSTLIRVPRP